MVDVCAGLDADYLVRGGAVIRVDRAAAAAIGDGGRVRVSGAVRGVAAGAGIHIDVSVGAGVHVAAAIVHAI